MTEFLAWPKTPRLFRDMIITEKIDGTNAAVQVVGIEDVQSWDGMGIPVTVDGQGYAVVAQSRKRLITPGDDNFGFASWAYANAQPLARVLGEGVHYGEWWGSGIQRGYGRVGLQHGIPDRTFSLFNSHRWADVKKHDYCPMNLDVVPVLYQGQFDTTEVQVQTELLRGYGSVAAPGFMQPEGVIVYHAASRSSYKALLENDDQPKGLVA